MKMKIIDFCDECNKKQYRNEMVNLYPELNYELDDLKEEFLNYDGMVCIECYGKMYNQQTKKMCVIKEDEYKGTLQNVYLIPEKAIKEYLEKTGYESDRNSVEKFINEEYISDDTEGIISLCLIQGYHFSTVKEEIEFEEAKDYILHELELHENNECECVEGLEYSCTGGMFLSSGETIEDYIKINGLI